VANHAKLIEQVIQFDHDLGDRLPTEGHIGDLSDSVPQYVRSEHIPWLAEWAKLGFHVIYPLLDLVRIACTAPAISNITSSASSPVAAQRQSAGQIYPMAPSGGAASPVTSTAVATVWPFGFRGCPLPGIAAKASVLSAWRGSITLHPLGSFCERSDSDRRQCGCRHNARSVYPHNVPTTRIEAATMPTADRQCTERVDSRRAVRPRTSHEVQQPCAKYDTSLAVE
jgi:hypothetical protein